MSTFAPLFTLRQIFILYMLTYILMHIQNNAQTNYEFYRKDRLRGTICFFLGMILVLFKWGIIGICLECFGFLNLFGNFLPVALQLCRQMPILGSILDLPVLSQGVDYIAGYNKPRYSV